MASLSAATKTRSRWRHGVQEFYDAATHEIIHRMSPFCFNDDFGGEELLTSEGGSNGHWRVLDTGIGGNQTTAIGADIAGGVARQALTATDEIEATVLDWNDQMPLILNQGLMVQYVSSLAVLPTNLAEAVWGLGSAEQITADAYTEAAWFKVDGDGAVVVETDDTANDNNDVATGVTLVAGEQHVFLIDFNTITDVKFYIDGASVATGTTFDMSTVAGLKLQPVMLTHKGDSTSLCTVDHDRVTVWMNRS